MIKIGIDFDNTIVNYDVVFQYLAKKNLLVDKSWIGSKKQLRELLVNKKNGVEVWKKLQGQAYGKYIKLSNLNSGVKNFLTRMNFLGVNVFIVSHKTIYGHYDKEKILLRSEALKWLSDNKFFKKNGVGIKKSDVFFESTINKKIERINKLELDFFIDDLELILNHSNFNMNTKKILFSLSSENRLKKNINIFNNWRDISHFIYGRETKKEIIIWSEKTLNKKILKAKLISGQKNSIIYKIQLKNRQNLALKYYPDLIIDPRKRLLTEYRALKYLKKNNIDNIPETIGVNENLNIAYYSWINGKNIKKIDYKEMKNAIRFLKKLKDISKSSKFNNKTYASECCLSIKEILRQIDNKLKILISIKNKPNNLIKFIKYTLIPVNNEILNKYNYLKNNNILNNNILKKDMILNPSDFGLHNAIVDKSNKIYFYDFEYFGWDDPTKLICDFFWHPGMIMKKKFKKYWLDESIKLFKNKKDFIERLELSLPLYGMRWALIILNDFTNRGKKILNHKNYNQYNQLEKFQNLQLLKSKKICNVLFKNHYDFKKYKS